MDGDLNKPKTTLTDGSPVTPDHRELKDNGQQKGYVVLSEEERARGFVRPVRQAYVHVGKQPTYLLRDLTEDEKKRYAGFGYIKFEKYPEEDTLAGRYWTEKQLNGGCGLRTVMALSIAETYARDPKFYGSTFCAGCGVHLPVEEFIWEGTDERVGS